MAAGYYEDGTITVALNGTAVTGVGTAFASRVRVGDKLTRNGFSVPIIGPTTDGKVITSNTALTLAYGFPVALTGSTYKIELLPDLTRALEAMEALTALMGNGTLQSEASIDGTGGNWISYFTGAGTKARTALTAFARTLIGGLDAASMRATLGAQPSIGTTIDNRVLRADGTAGGVQQSNVVVDDTGNLAPSTYDGASLGTNPLGWSDVWIAAGGELIFAQGNAKITHATNQLTYTATSGHLFNGMVAPYANNAANLGSPSVRWGAAYFVTATFIGTFSSTGATRGTTMDFTTISHSATSTATEYVMALYNPNGLVGSISTTGSATAYATSSDYRLKENVVSLVEFEMTEDMFDLVGPALLRMLLLRPVSHTWIADPAAGAVHGLIAHEAQPIVPHGVTGSKDATVDIGTAVIAAYDDPDVVLVPAYIIPADGDTVERLEPAVIAVGEHHAEQVFEGILQAQAPEGSVWTKTGTQILPQGVDHSKFVPDLIAALQELTLIVIDQKRRLDDAGL